MSTRIEVIYEHGLLRPLKPLSLPEGTRVAIVLLEPMTVKLTAVREAMSDPLFLADMEHVAEDFKFVDAE